MDESATERLLRVQAAQLALEGALLLIQKQHTLTLLECLHLLAAILAHWTERALQTR